MKKRIFSIFFTVIILIASVFPTISASAYEVTGFDISAKAGMLISLDTEEILFERNINKKVYPASITKIMTAIIMLESDKFVPEAKVAMTKEILSLILGTGSAVSNLKAGEEITQLDLLYYVLLSSSGDCAYLAAQYYGETIENFVTLMNKKAAELGMKNTVFLNPTGLHEDGHYTTVNDIYIMATYAMKNDLFKKVTGSRRYTVQPTNMTAKTRTLSTTNFLLDNTTNYYYQYAQGVKTGFTNEAGRCVVSTASYKGYTYMCIVMGCPDSKAKRYEFYESRELYKWAFLNFSFEKVANSSEPVCEIPVELSMDTDFVSLYFKEPFVTLLPNDADESTIVVKPKLKEKSVDAPVKKGDVLGTADIIYAEKVIGTAELVAGNDVEAHWILAVFRGVKNFFSSVYMKIIYAVIGVFAFVFIIVCVRLNISQIKKRRVKYIPYKSERSEKKR